MGFPWWLRWQRIHLQCSRPRFDPWVRNIPWRRGWHPITALLPGEFHGQRSLVAGCVVDGVTKNQCEQLTHTFLSTWLKLLAKIYSWLYSWFICRNVLFGSKFRKNSAGSLVWENEMNGYGLKKAALNDRNLRKTWRSRLATHALSSNIWIWKSYQDIFESINKHYSVECNTVMSLLSRGKCINFLCFEKI